MSADCVVDARVRDDDHNARQEDAKEEEHLLGGLSLGVLENCTGEGLHVQAQTTVDSEEGWHLEEGERVIVELCLVTQQESCPLTMSRKATPQTDSS